MPSVASLRLDSQTCALPDGRVLGFAEYGDPAGHAVLYFHGFPSSRLEAAAAHEAARHHGLRLLALDRPGCGLSTAQPGRRVVDWVDDVQAFAQQQKLARFAVLGYSGGGPFALACACRLPAAMLTGVGVMAGAGPFDSSAGDDHMPRRLRITLALLCRCPSAVRLVLAGPLSGLRWLSHTTVASWLTGKGDGTVDEVEADKVDKAGRAGRPENMRLLAETFAQGTEGMLEDGAAFSDFGFRYEDVTYDPVQFWHGDKDVNVPLDWVRPMVAKIPHAVFRLYEGKTHVDLLDHLDEMLAGLVPKGDGEPPLTRADTDDGVL